MNINELTIGQAKELTEMFGGGQSKELPKELPFDIGQKLFVRTVTYHVTGEVVAIIGDWLVLDKAAWIADSGRFSEALKTCEFNEVEMYAHQVYVNAGTITDATVVDVLPEESK